MQQDTVLQHARMYGARPRADLAVTRLNTSAGNHAALQQIHNFDAALRDAFLNGAHDQGVAFVFTDAANRVVPCAPDKVLMSDLTPLRPGEAFLPVGFQTKAKSTIAKIVEKVGALVPDAARDAGRPVKISTDDAIKIIDLIQTTLDDSDFEPFDWKAMRGVIEYYSRIAAPVDERGYCWLMATTDSNIVRMRPGGRFSNAPFSPEALAKAHGVSGMLPVLMVIRQNGAEAKGWRNAPFWWPVLFPPLKSAPAVFAASVVEGDVSMDEDDEV